MTAPPSSSPTILVVDLDEAVRTLLYQAFRKAGYNVLLASSGEAALRLYEAAQSEVTLLLLSAQRPGLNGRRMLAALQEINPAVRCIIATDVSPEEELLPLLRQGAIGLLPKPLNPDDAVSLVSRVMEEEMVRESAMK
jgi:DNA-binding NtrC family response regulator